MEQFENKIDELSNNFSITVNSIERVLQSFEMRISKLRDKDNALGSTSDSVSNFLLQYQIP